MISAGRALRSLLTLALCAGLVSLSDAGKAAAEPGTYYHEDFEADDGGFSYAPDTSGWGGKDYWAQWYTAYSEWEWSGESWEFFTTYIEDGHPDNLAGWWVEWLESPDIDLTGAVGDVILRWLQFQSAPSLTFPGYGIDGQVINVYVQISSDGGASWTQIYGGAPTGWTEQQVALPESYFVEDFRIRFGCGEWPFVWADWTFGVDDIFVGLDLSSAGILEYILALPDDAFDGKKKKKAKYQNKEAEKRKRYFEKKLAKYEKKLAKGDIEGAIKELRKHLVKRVDGKGKDFIVDPDAQADLIAMIEALIANLELLL